MYFLLQVMKKNHMYLAGLSMPVQHWREDMNYKIVEEVFPKLFIVISPC